MSEKIGSKSDGTDRVPGTSGHGHAARTKDVQETGLKNIFEVKEVCMICTRSRYRVGFAGHHLSPHTTRPERDDVPNYFSGWSDLGLACNTLFRAKQTTCAG